MIIEQDMTSMDMVTNADKLAGGILKLPIKLQSIVPIKVK
jgi:hypothetical protein